MGRRLRYIGPEYERFRYLLNLGLKSPGLEEYFDSPYFEMISLFELVVQQELTGKDSSPAKVYLEQVANYYDRINNRETADLYWERYYAIRIGELKDDITLWGQSLFHLFNAKLSKIHGDNRRYDSEMSLYYQARLRWYEERFITDFRSEVTPYSHIELLHEYSDYLRVHDDIPGAEAIEVRIEELSPISNGLLDK